MNNAWSSGRSSPIPAEARASARASRAARWATPSHDVRGNQRDQTTSSTSQQRSGSRLFTCATSAARQWTLLLAGLVLAAIAFWRLLPRPHAGWVIYNISEGRWRSALEAAARAAGIVGKWHGRTWQDAAGELSFSYTTFSQLRNVSVQIQADGGNVASHAERIGARLDAQFERMEQLPSASGALLLIVGILVTLFPVWLLGRHAHDVAQAVARLFG